MSRTVVITFLGTAMLAAVFHKSTDIQKLFADDREVAKRCNNAALAPFVPLDAAQRIAATSHAIDRIVLTDPDPNAGRSLNDWKKADAAHVQSNYGSHFARITFRRKSPLDVNEEIFTPHILYHVQLLPDFQRFRGVHPHGRLAGFYWGSEMTPENDWFPAETKLGMFGATFSTQKAESPQGDREFVRVPTPPTNKPTCFSLPIDLAAERTIKDSFGLPPVRMPPHAEYLDFGHTEWIIYSRIVEYGVEISHCETLWNYANGTRSQTGDISTQRYKIGDMFQVSNLKFRIEEIVSFDKQEVPAAWFNISDIDVVRP